MSNEPMEEWRKNEMRTKADEKAMRVRRTYKGNEWRERSKELKREHIKKERKHRERKRK